MGDGWDVSYGMTMCVFSIHMGKVFVFLGFSSYSGLNDGDQIKSLKFNSIGKNPEKI